jgi:hypothetical protein
MYTLQNMRSKREESKGAKVPFDGCVEKKRPIATKSTGRRNQENGGEVLVRYITSQCESDTELVNGYTKNPFIDNNCHTNSTSTLPHSQSSISSGCTIDSTKFHLGDDEMLLELMIHLHADCPDLMHDKTDLIERVSKLYDKLHQTPPPA